jgi:hypothetical protein
MRISPQARHTLEVLALFREGIDNASRLDDAARRIQALVPDVACDGFWRGRPGMEAGASS